MVLIYDDGPVPPPRKIDELRKMPLITDPPSLCQSVPPPRKIDEDWNAVRYKSMMTVQYPLQA
jgi:hypothetical protein